MDYGNSHSSKGKGSKLSDSKPNDSKRSPEDLGVTFCEEIKDSPEKLGLSNSGPNQTPDAEPKMRGNRPGWD